jgi:hypothetical protein
MNGAKVVEIGERMIPENKRAKKGFKWAWQVVLEDVSDEAVKQWKQGTPIGNLKEFRDTRLKLKRKIKKPHFSLFTS